MSRVSAPRSAADLSARSSRWSEPEKRGLVVSMTVVEMPARRTGPGARSGLRESGCGWCGAFARRDGAATLTSTRPLSTLMGNAGTRSSSNPGSPTPVRRWNFQPCQGQVDVIAVEAAFAERSTDVVADIRHRAELSILERDRNGDSSGLATLQRRPREHIGTADVDPVLSTNHGVPPNVSVCFEVRCEALGFCAKAAITHLC